MPVRSSSEPENFQAYILKAYDLWFILHIKISNGDKIYQKLFHLHRNNKQEFEYKIILEKGGNIFSFFGQTEALNDCLNLQEKPTTISKISIEKFHQIYYLKFNINIQEVEPQKWLNFFTAPCKNVGKSCIHEDYPNKCLKHEKYFCPYFTTCEYCDISMIGGELISHFLAKHDNLVQNPEEFWRPSSTGNKPNLSVINFNKESVICEYKFSGNIFSMFLYTPFKSDELKNCTCEVKFRNLSTKNLNRFLLDPVKKEIFDFCLEFETNDSLFDICVTIDTKINNNKISSSLVC